VALRVKVLRQRDRLTLKEIAIAVGLSRATVARIVARCGWSRLHVLELPPTSRRYERARPGELVHLDIKKLARIVRPGHRISGDRRHTVRGAGWQFAHMAIDDHSRVGYGEMLPDERGGTAAGFLQRTVRGLRRLGVRVAAVMTDNGSCYRSKRFAATCRHLGIRQLFTRPYTPRTNGKAERFIKTSLGEWAYARLLSSFRRAQPRADRLAAPLQLASAAYRDRWPPPDYPGRLRGQPGETPQLGGSSACCAELTEPGSEEGIEQRGGGHEGDVRPLRQKMLGTLRGGDAAHGKDGAIPCARLPP
jgi:transposase InsO family protein